VSTKKVKQAKVKPTVKRIRSIKKAKVEAIKEPPLRDGNGRFIRVVTQDDLLSTEELEQSRHEDIKFEYVKRPSRDVGELAFAELNNRIVRQKEWEENEARLLLEEAEKQVRLQLEEKKLKNRVKNFALSSWYELKYTSLLAKIWLVESLWVKPVKSIRLMGTRTKNYFKRSNNSKIR
jgi:hypothetical protein